MVFTSRESCRAMTGSLFSSEKPGSCRRWILSDSFGHRGGTNYLHKVEGGFPISLEFSVSLRTKRSVVKGM